MPHQWQSLDAVTVVLLLVNGSRLQPACAAFVLYPSFSASVNFFQEVPSSFMTCKTPKDKGKQTKPAKAFQMSSEGRHQPVHD